MNVRLSFRAASTIGPHIPTGMGDLRFAAEVYRVAPAPDPAVRVLKDGARLFLEPHDWPQAQAWLLGRYDIQTVMFVLEQLSDGGTFFDVGAHVGLISHQVAALRPSVEIHAFEPHPKVAPIYRQNTELNGANATLVQAAASDRPGSITFDMDTHSVGGNAEVETLRLDDYISAQGIPRVDVMKLDVEGHELEALEGATRSLESGIIRAVTLEAMDAHGDTQAPSAFLQDHGYRRVEMPAAPFVAFRRRIGAAPEEPNAAYLRG